MTIIRHITPRRRRRRCTIHCPFTPTAAHTIISIRRESREHALYLSTTGRSSGCLPSSDKEEIAFTSLHRRYLSPIYNGVRYDEYKHFLHSDTRFFSREKDFHGVVARVKNAVMSHTSYRYSLNDDNTLIFEIPGVYLFFKTSFGIGHALWLTGVWAKNCTDHAMICA